jgi:predicted anti-sigma-YlaC factor YlaD
MKTKTLSRQVGRLSKPAKLTCKEIAKHICGELDDKLDSPRCHKIKEHLAKCPNCTAYLDSLKKTIRLYRGYSNPKLSNTCRKELFSVLKLKRYTTTRSRKSETPRS